MPTLRTLIRILPAAFAFVVGYSGRAADVAVQTLEHLNGLRGIQVPKEKEKTAELNARMDSTWEFVRKHREVALPVVETELKRAIAADPADQFFLLDMAFLLTQENGTKDATLAVGALERLDPAAEVIRANWKELFDFVMRLGAGGGETDRYLAQVDRIYFSNKEDVTFFLAPHYVQLNPLDVACMVYGVTGQAGASHLAHRLALPGADQKRILVILSAIGSEVDVPTVNQVMTSATDEETIARCVTFMAEVGGPSGRAAVLARNPRNLSAAAQKKFDQSRRQVERLGFDSLVAGLTEISQNRVSDRKLRQLLDRMEENNGEDSETPPAMVATSGLPTHEVLAQMKRIRARSFRRETNHVFEDLPIANAIINALQYRLAAEAHRAKA
ncbi:MAG TPA: hypothetical protein VHD32_12935 [Candidatus Didemnitutus sp.]|nr:hypothetical protein [Candidatus Didemnitutus sp.]